MRSKIKVLEMIATDMKNDAKNFDGNLSMEKLLLNILEIKGQQ